MWAPGATTTSPRAAPRPRKKILQSEHSNPRPLLHKFGTNHQTTHILVFRNKQYSYLNKYLNTYLYDI
jgi:hypothetical protein